MRGPIYEPPHDPEIIKKHGTKLEAVSTQEPDKNKESQEVDEHAGA